VALANSLIDLRNQMLAGEVSAEKVCQSYLDQIQATNPGLNAYCYVHELALERARQLDKQKERKGRLWGVPVAVKDNFCVSDMPCTASSRMLENFVPPYTAHCVQLWEQEGAVIVGKTNMDEFGMGSSNETSYWGPTKNPWNQDCVPGGSSGGSAAAIASGLALAALGSDTGGSVRQPASFCGVVGIKPTYGSISRYGLIAFASSLDQAGVFAGSVADAALALDPLIAKDPKDATNVERQVGSVLTESDGCRLKGVRLGLPKEFFERDLEPDLRQQIQNLMDQLKQEGAELIEVSLPHSSLAIPVYYVVAACEASSNLARYDGVRYGYRSQSEGGTNDLNEFYIRNRSEAFGEEVKRRILLGTFALSADSYDSFYKRASQVRRLIAQDFIHSFQQCDFIMGPVATSAAFPLGGKIKDPIAMYDNDIFTTPASLAGLPCMSLPIGLNSNSLPLGIQLIAPSFQEDKMLALAQSLENICGRLGRPSDA
jgi:aspartyl-tRNA(Asn)/glutamyl-tRNA(Gln) amidotransferase subunit A